MGEIIIEIPKYITHVELAKARRAKRYKVGDRIPKKFKDFEFNDKGVLVDDKGIPIIKNPATAGTPRLKKINGQEIYSGRMHPRVRAKVIAEMKTFFRPFFDDIDPVTEEELPVKIAIEMHTPLGNGMWDLDNLWVYTKVLQDVIVDKGILPDDNVQYITNSGENQFVPTDTDEERKIIVTIVSNNEGRHETTTKHKDIGRTFGG